MIGSTIICSGLEPQESDHKKLENVTLSNNFLLNLFHKFHPSLHDHWSGLLIDIERQLFHWVTGRYAAVHELAMS